MTFVSPWERLLDACRRVMAANRCSQLEARIDICRAIAHGVIGLRGKLKRHTIRPMRSRDTVLERSAFQIPTQIDPDEFDWDRSCPKKPWFVERGLSQTHGYWELEWIELSKADVTKSLCNAGSGEAPTQRAESAVAHADRLPADSLQDSTTFGLGSTERLQTTAGRTRRRGPRPVQFNRVKAAMVDDVRQGALSLADLEGMLEKTLEERYHVSRDTARKARRAVLLELGAI